VEQLMDVLREILLPKLEGVKMSGGSWMARCPAHEDGKASLHIARGDTQPVVLTCHAGCERAMILDAIGLTWDTLCEPRDDQPGEWTPNGPAVAVYDYTDEHGTLLYQVLRSAGKQFCQRIPDVSRRSGWRWKLDDTRRVLYRLPQVIEAIKDGEIIYVAEGEKDVQALERAGAVATCNSGGAGKWRAEFAEVLSGAIVRIVADKDEVGQAHARQVWASLEGIAAATEIIEGAGECKDAAEHLASGHTLADFEVTRESAQDETPDLAPDLYEFISVIDPPDEWVIPGILERGDRLIWTGYEGLGKSVLTRQLAVCAAAGIHPFSGEEFEPQRVLFIDCENPDRKSRRHFRKLERVARWKGRAVPEGLLRILQRPAGVDLTRDDGAAWLLERVTAHKPDLLVVGPLYRLHATDTNEEKAARLIVQALDAARIKADCALITEAHAGHGEAALNRSVRPAGSSLFLRWPEFGYGIKPLGDADDNGHHRNAAVVTWRGPREERHWPRELCWGDGESDWPWIVPSEHPQVRAARSGR
jgi:hypothetical protein